MSFAGGNGYAAGDFGTILKTTDGGSSWTGLRSGSYTNLTEVQAVDANTVVAGGGCVARLSKDGGKTFSRIAFTNVESSCPSNLAAMSFVSANTGFIALNDGTVIATDDGGQTFASKVAIPSTAAVGGTAPPTALNFVSSTQGIAAAGSHLYRTLDGGSSWSEVASTGLYETLYDIEFADASVGYAAGNGKILKTIDGGATWNAVSTPGGRLLTQVSCASALLCVFTTGTGDVIVRTDDGGATFTTPSPSTAPIFAAAFNSTTQLAAGGADGTQVKSDDGGVTFAPVGSRLTGSYTAIRQGKALNSAFALGRGGALAKTVNGGQTWTRANVATSQDIRDVAFPSTTTGYALDSSGGLFVTTNGSSTWKTLDPGTKSGRALYSPKESTVLLVGSKGLRRSTNGGATFNSVKSKAVSGKRLTSADSAGLYVEVKGNATAPVVVYGSKNIALSTNGGSTFKKIAKPRKAKTIKSIVFANPKLGFVIGSDGRVWRTANGGKKWREVVTPGTNQARKVSFPSANSNNGYLVIDKFGDSGSGGWLLATNDGGKTWFPQFVVSQSITSIEAGPASGYVLAGTSSLLFSTPLSNTGAGAPNTLTIKTAKRKLKKAATIKVTGKLTGAQGNERVAVLYRKPGNTKWTTKMATVSASGTFTTSWKVAKGSNQFVAQWAGDFRFKGDGSPVLSVKAKKK